MQLLKPLHGTNIRNIEEKFYVIKHDVFIKRSEPKGVTGESKQKQQRYQAGLLLLIRRKAIDLLELWFDICAVCLDELWKILCVKQSMRPKKDMERRQILFHLFGKIYMMWSTLEATGVGTWFVAEPWIWQQIRPWQKGRSRILGRVSVKKSNALHFYTLMKTRHRKSVHWFKTWLSLYYFILKWVFWEVRQ